MKDKSSKHKIEKPNWADFFPMHRGFDCSETDTPESILIDRLDHWFYKRVQPVNDILNREYPLRKNSNTSTMTLREYYAGLALQGIMANPNIICVDSDGGLYKRADIKAYAIQEADALIAELQKESEREG